MKNLRTRLFLACGLALVAAGVAERQPSAAGNDVVMYASDATNASGNWTMISDSTAANGQRLASSDNGWSSTDGALSNPNDFFEVTFTASSGTPYHVWLRLRAGASSKYNDSVYVQFSDSVDSNGSAIYRIGTTSALTVNLQSCNGCALGGWGWMDGAYWLSQLLNVRFANTGGHTVRVQTREDGVSFDQMVLSPSTYLSSAPGQVTNDSTIVPKSGSTTTPTSGSNPYGGTPISLPGTIAAANYDTGGEGVAYHDASAGNSGGSYRNDNVDIEPSSEGGYDVGWTSPGEWLNYTVNVATSGTYNAEIRVASPSGGQMHIGFNGGTSVWKSVTIPATGDWQSWTSVNVSVSLAAGKQIATLMFDTSGINLEWVKVTNGGASTPSTPTTSSPYSGSPVSLPGTVNSWTFDNGGEGVAYHDASPGNAGGAFRSTDVDLEACSEGGYDVGWTSSGEWLNYSVNVSASGGYTAQLRVASPNGAQMHLGFNGSSSVWASVTVPATGGWQNWTTVNVPVTLGAGTQLMTVGFDNGGVNFEKVAIVSGAAPPPPPPPSSPSGGTSVSAVTWNIDIKDNSESHARVAMDTLLQVGPQPSVIVIQEAYKDYFGTYIDELQRQTGQTWYGAWASHCASGDWNGSSCNTQWYQGIAIFSTYAITGSSSTLFPYSDCWTSARAGLRASLNVNGVTLQVFTTHLQTGGCTNDQQARYNSMSRLKTWAANYSGPQIVAGDFNADPDQIDTSSGMSPNFIDAWSVVGSGLGWSAFGPDPSMKIDYWFNDLSGRAIPTATHVVYWSGSISDHYPVQTTFTIR